MTKKPLSDARLAANRLNAKKSTGPRSIEGKSISRNNSFKHGLTGAVALLPSDDRDAHELYVDALVDSLHPGSPLEYEIARDVADAHWRLRRISSVEAKMLTLQADPPAPVKTPAFDPYGSPYREPVVFTPDMIGVESDEPPRAQREDDLHTAARVCLDRPTSLTNIALYEQRIHRSIKHSMDELRRLQSEREAAYEQQMTSAIRHYQHQIMQDLSFDPAAHGFVFSLDEVDRALTRHLLEKRVEFAAKINFDLVQYRKNYPPKAA